VKKKTLGYPPVKKHGNGTSPRQEAAHLHGVIPCLVSVHYRILWNDVESAFHHIPSLSSIISGKNMPKAAKLVCPTGIPGFPKVYHLFPYSNCCETCKSPSNHLQAVTGDGGGTPPQTIG